MPSIRNKYLSDMDAETLSIFQQQASFNARLPLCVVAIPPNAISPDGTEWLHCVEATKRNKLCHIRVITNTHRGVNIIIPCVTKEMYYKYMDLRFQVRNNDRVLVTFPELFVESSKMNKELYIRASDFKIFDPNTTNDRPTPSIII